MSRLHGADSQFLNERQRQAELARLKREQRRAEQEEKFGTAALVMGLAERNNAAVQEKYVIKTVFLFVLNIFCCDFIDVTSLEEETYYV